MTTLWAGGIYGTYRYIQDQREASGVAAEMIRFDTDTLERLRCEQRVESRTGVRAVFTGLFDLIDEFPDSTGGFPTEARLILDAEYPPLRLEDCPPTPNIQEYR